MKLLKSLLLQLPHSLLLSTIALTAALPVESVELTVLTPENFKDTIAKGIWFIEHFSPYCGHCRKFMPTWEQLVEDNQKASDPGINLAQVNCAINGDLCNQNGVDGYPQMNLYRDGQFIETYRQSRDYDLLTEYLAKHAEPSSPVSTNPPDPKPTPPTPEQEVLSSRVDDEKVYNPQGTVLSLNGKNFFETIKDGHVFVKFFAPWCGHCKKLAPVWENFALRMKDKMTIAEVNCEDNSALCRTQDVLGYPMLIYYTGSGKDDKTEYTGGRRIDQLVAFADKMSGPPVREVQATEFQKIVMDTPVSYLFLHPQSDTQGLKLVTEKSQILFGSPPVYSSSSPALYTRFSMDQSSSYLLAFKDHDADVPAASYRISPTASLSDEEAFTKDWMLRNRFPTSLQLGSESFQEVMNAPHKPLVVLAAIPPTESQEHINKLQFVATRWRTSKSKPDVVFTWMESDRWASWLKSMYGIKSNALPAVVIANHSQLIYYDRDQYGNKIDLTWLSISSAVIGATAGTIKYKHSENTIERFARFINDKISFAEAVIFGNPKTSIAFVFFIIVGIIWFIKRLLNEDEENLRRSSRLD